MQVKRRSSLVEVGSKSDDIIQCEDSSHLNTDGNPIKSQHSQFIHENSAGKDSAGESPSKLLRVNSPNSWFSHKVSRDKIKKSNNRGMSLLIDDFLGKQARKSKEIESPSRKAATMFSSMELGVDNEISRIQFGREDLAMPDLVEKDDFHINFEGNERPECVPSCSGKESFDTTSIMCSIENQCDKDLLWQQRSEYPQKITQTVCPDHPSIPTSYNSMEKSRKKYTGGPADPNGRFKGRKLVLWHRPRMMEKLLLNIQYECFKAKIRIPWDEIVHRLEPGCSGPSAVQMLNKMRDVLIIEGHMIPPAMGNGIQPDPDVRGYVRDLNAEVPGSTRILRWTENYPNAPRSLSDSGFIRGSGNYRKVVTRGGAFNKIPRTIEERGHARKVIPEEAYSPSNNFRVRNGGKSADDNPAINPRRGKPRALWKKPGPKPRSKSKSESRFPSESQAAESFIMRPKANEVTQGFSNKNDSSSIVRPGSEKNLSRDDSSSEESDFIKHRNSRRSSQSSSKNWPSSDEVFSSASENRICEVKNGNLTIRLSPVDLARVDSGLAIHHSSPLVQIMDGLDGLAHQEQRRTGCPMELEGHEKVTKHVGIQSYKGVEEHGTLPDFAQALASGRDPRINGWKYLRLSEKLEKMREPDISADASRRNTSVEASRSNEFLKNSNHVNKSMSQNAVGSPWTNTNLVPGLKSSLTLVAGELSAEYKLIQQTRLFENVSPGDYNSITEASSANHDSISILVNSQKEQQEDNLAQICTEIKGIGYIEENFFSSPAEIHNDSAQECQFLLGGMAFEDLVTDSSESISHPRSVTFDLYGDNENIPEENYQISVWQNEFLNEQEDEIPELQD